MSTKFLLKVFVTFCDFKVVNRNTKYRHEKSGCILRFLSLWINFSMNSWIIAVVDHQKSTTYRYKISPCSFCTNGSNVTESWLLVCTMVYPLSALNESTLHWRDTRDFLICTKHLLILHWLTQLWQQHVNDGVRQQKYNHLSWVSEWSTG